MAKEKEIKIEILDVAMVLYTDGSAGPTFPGYLGMGYHGYFYPINKEMKKTADLPLAGYPSKEGYIGPDNIAAHGKNIEHIKITPIGYLDGYFSDSKTMGHSNLAEINAIRYGIDSVIEYFKNNKDKYILKELNIYSDSSYALIIYNKALKHFKNNKTYNELSKEELFVNLKNIYRTLKDTSINALMDAIKFLFNKLDGVDGISIKLHKVAGHSGNIGNEQADMLAVTARVHASNGNPVDKSDWTSTRYWKPKVDRHPLLRYKELFFMHNTDNFLDSSKGYFTIMNYGTIEVGTRSSAPLYGIVRLGEPPALIKSLTDKYKSKYRDNAILVYAVDLNKLYLPVYQRYINNYGVDSVVSNKRNQLVFMTKDPVAYPVYPLGLAKKVYSQTTEFIDVLEQARIDLKNNYENGNGKFYIDITDKIYQGEGKKRVCILPNANKEIKLKDIQLDKDKVDITLVHDIDMINRNHFKALEKNDDLKVYLLIEKEGTRVYRYYTLLFCPSIDCYGCWQNLFSSKIFLKNK